MSRNALMSGIALLAAGALVAASLGAYRVFSYVAGVFILAVVAAACDAVVDEIISEARDRQQRADVPLEPRRIERATSTDGLDRTADVEGNDD